ncbi:hypothetical protein U9M48_003793 [Paspalum notatum var. saurae]|uniref:Uncharacterized protein n=1 Tax=Paspalum notatum var. saurae TaxID=547442 RepID=A0AAQ3PIZ3_PASNO
MENLISSTRASDDQGKESNYYGIIQKILEFKFIGDKDLKLFFFVCNWFEPNRGVRENQYGMVEVKHNEKLKGNDNWRMSRKLKQIAKGFAGKMIPSKERLFQGSTSTGSRREALLRCMDPNLQGVPIALQRNEGEEDEEVEEAEAEDAGDRQEDENAGDGHEGAQADADLMGGDEDLMGGDGSEEVVVQTRGTRKSHYVHPPPIPATADKILIRPISDCQWEDVTWDGTGHHRTPNGLLGNLIRVHNPGVVQKDGETIPVTTWKHYALAPHVTTITVWIPQSRIMQVTNCWLKSQGQPLGHFRDASEMYLTAKKYASVSHPLIQDQPGPYKALCDLWASEGFQAEYGKEMERRHGEGFDWRNAPVDPQTVYDSGGGKSHGRYSMCNA